MDWSGENKLCCIGHCRQNVFLWDTWYIDDKKKFNKGVLILLEEK
jgi:hypothetical protein